MSYIYEIVVISRSPTCTDDSINMVTMKTTSLGDVVVQQAVLNGQSCSQTHSQCFNWKLNVSCWD